MADNENKVDTGQMSPKGFFDQSNKTTSFVDKLASGDNKGAGEDFKDALRNKVGDALDASRKEYASNLFNTAKNVMTPGQAEPHSDPKPNVADPIAQTASRDDVQNAMTPEAEPVSTPAEAPAEAPAETAPDSGETQTGE
jgi:hypothetical protein